MGEAECVNFFLIFFLGAIKDGYSGPGSPHPPPWMHTEEAGAQQKTKEKKKKKKKNQAQEKKTTTKKKRRSSCSRIRKEEEEKEKQKRKQKGGGGGGGGGAAAAAAEEEEAEAPPAAAAERRRRSCKGADLSGGGGGGAPRFLSSILIQMSPLPLPASALSPPPLHVAGTPCLLNSLLRFGSRGRKAFFGISLSCQRDGGRLLKAGIVPLLSVGSIVSSGLGHAPWSGVCKNLRKTGLSLGATKNDNSAINEVTQKPEDSTMNHATKQKAASSPKVAFFDVDGTITRTNVVVAYFTHRMTELSFIVKLLWVPCFAITCIFYLIVDSINRAVFNRIFYLRYKGRSVQCKTEMADLIYRNYYRPRIFAGAVELIQRLKQDGYQIVFVTGCLDFLIAPLARDLGADYVYAAELAEENGRFTGKLKGMAASNAEKAERVQEYARRHGISLGDSLAFGDSVADLPMLEVVGRPHVVNPDVRLQALAAKRGWPIINWALEPRAASAIAV